MPMVAGSGRAFKVGARLISESILQNLAPLSFRNFSATIGGVLGRSVDGRASRFPRRLAQ